MKRFKKEHFEAARAAKTPDKLIAMAKEAGIDLTREQAEHFVEASSGELADDALAGVSGGGGLGESGYVCPFAEYEAHKAKADNNGCSHWVTMYGGYTIKACFMCLYNPNY